MTQGLLTPVAKPRIAIMGEFSAGKSTLCNLLLRSRPLPEKVTATRLPPVWMSKGPGRDHRVTLDGKVQPVIIDGLDRVPFEDTRHVRLHFDAEILDHCDFIDFPGISDPNMDAEVWERVLVEADAVIWLTHATQAWRQSEAAVWETVPEEVRKKSVLLITRFDKLVTEMDRARVVARVTKETDGYFHKVFPISLTRAIEGFSDFELWESSGAAAFTDHLVDMIGDLSAERAAREAPEDDKATDAEGDDASASAAAARVHVKRVGPSAPSDAAAATGAVPEGARVIPRRVRPQGAMRRSRPGSISAQSLAAD